MWSANDLEMGKIITVFIIGLNVTSRVLLRGGEATWAQNE